MQKCWADPQCRIAPTTAGIRVVDARTARCVDVYGHIPLWQPQNADEWPVHADRLRCRNVAEILGVGLY